MKSRLRNWIIGTTALACWFLTGSHALAGQCEFGGSPYAETIEPEGHWSLTADQYNQTVEEACLSLEGTAIDGRFVVASYFEYGSISRGYCCAEFQEQD